MLYAFGSNGSAQLGVGHAEDVASPRAITSDEDSTKWRVKQFAAGGNHTVILCDDGRVRVAGNNEDGRCASFQTDTIHGFRQLNAADLASQVVLVTANWSVTTVTCIDGDVWTRGTGNSGELGLGSGLTTSPTFQRLQSFPPPGTRVTDIASGMAHTIAVLSTGEVYGWGKGRKGQLGEPAEDQWEPRRIEGITFRPIKAVCGKDFTLVVGEPGTGQIVVLGPNGNDRFGVKANAPTALQNWRDLAASWGSIFVLDHAGNVFAWGRDDHGQLPAHDLPKIEAIGAGSEHCLALTTDGRVLAWGWGEHGNCGKPTDERGNVKAKWNEIEVSGHAARVFAGCATSFIELEDPEG